MDGRDLRHGLRLADGEALAPRPVRAGRGGLHSRRGRKLAAGAAAEVREATGAVGQRGQRHAALRRRHASPCMAVSRPETWQKAADGDPPRGLPAARRAGRRRPNWPRPRSRRPPSWSSAGRRCKQAADSLGRSFLTTGDPLFDKAYVEGIQKVTAEQVRDVARRYFVPRAAQPRHHRPAGRRAEAGRGGGRRRPRARSALVRLPNGLRVLLKRHAQLPLVNIQAFVLGGSLVDSEKTAGRAALVGAMLDKGTAEHSAQQIAEYFDSIGGQLGIDAGPVHRLRQRHGAARRFPRGGRAVRRVLHAADVSRGGVRQGAAACPRGDRPPGRRSAGRNQRVLLRQPAGRLALPRRPGRQGRDGRAAHGRGPAAVPRQVLRAEQHDRHRLRRHRPRRGPGAGQEAVRRPEAGRRACQPIAFDRRNAIAEDDRPPQADRQADGHGDARLSGARASSTRRTTRR